MMFGLRLGMAVVAVAACSQPTAPLATAEPGVVYSYPIDAQLDVPLGARVVVTFSDPVDPSAIAACSGTGAEVTGAFCLVGPDGPVDATAEVVGDGKTVQLAGVGFAPGTRYGVYVRPALAPTARNLPAAGPLFSFTTRSTPARAAAPVVVAINGAAPTAPEAFRPMFESSTIRLVFSEPLDPRTVALAPGAIELVDMTSGTAVPATLFANGIHVSIDPIADLVAGNPYQVTVGGKVADLGGQPVAPASIPVTPKRIAADPPIPQMLRTRQAGDRGAAASHAGAERNVISIDKPLIGKETSQVLPSVLAVELGDPKALGGPIAFTIRRGQRLKASGLDVKLGGELPVGLSTGDIEIELLTDGGGRIYRNPYQPADQHPDNERSPLLVDLSMDVAVYAADPNGNAVLTQTVLGLQSSGTAIATDGVLDIETVIAMDLDLLGVARAPTNLVLELISDPAATPDPDQTSPTLLAPLPNGAGDEVPVDAGVALIFSEPIDLDRARAGGVSLETMTGLAVANVIESHGAAIVIRPVAPLAPSTSYRVTLADVADLAGNPLAGAGPMSFSTLPPLVATSAPLTVASVHPGVPCALTGGTAGSPGRCAGGASGDDLYQPFSLAANEPIEVSFTQPPVPASITHATSCNAGSVRIEEVDAGGACVAAVAGTWRQHDRVLAFVPEVPWQAGKRYRLTLVSGSDRSCAAGEICGISGNAASFDPLGGGTSDAAGGPNLVIGFAGAPATDATLVITGAAPFTDINGSGFEEAGERNRDDNRVALRVAGTTGVVSSAIFNMPDCLPATAEKEACMYLSGAMPVELLPLAHGCPLPGGETAASCVPVVLSPEAMYGTSVAIDATAVIGVSTVRISTVTGMFVMRIREPASGPVTGYLIDDRGTPTLVVSLELYLDAPDMSLPLLTHDVHSKPLSVSLRGPLRFLPDGRIAIAAGNVDDVPIAVNITGTGVSGSIQRADRGLGAVLERRQPVALLVHARRAVDPASGRRGSFAQPHPCCCPRGDRDEARQGGPVHGRRGRNRLADRSRRSRMTPAEVFAIRTSLNMTQGQLAQLLGVHSLTVSKWERGHLHPTPHQEALLRAAAGAAQRTPDVGAAVIAALVGAGVGVALFHLLRAAFEPATAPRMIATKPRGVRRRS
jgi:DNA-binding transcriptional regulator YiaG